VTGFLTTFPADPHHVLPSWIGQRSATFRFEWINGVTGELLGELHPLRGASLSHDTTRTIKRQLNLSLGVQETAAVNPLTDRVDLFMVFHVEQPHEHPLGRFMFTDASREKYTIGKIGSFILNDEMFLVDQEIPVGINGRKQNVGTVISTVLAGLGIRFDLAATPFTSAESWPVGTTRGQVLESLAVTGDYFSPWFGNDQQLHFIRSFDPATQVPQFDFDSADQVLRTNIIESDDLLTAPNRFVVISNAPDDSATAVVGTADVPATAPHSITNRGFVIQKTVDLQVTNLSQAQAVAQNLALRRTVFERINLVTVPDPRHDSYDVIKWQNDLWLELAWNMSLDAGGTMSHLLRKAY
jgi:hypothetical protein